MSRHISPSLYTDIDVCNKTRQIVFTGYISNARTLPDKSAILAQPFYFW